MTEHPTLNAQQVRQIDTLCDRFEAELRSGAKPKIEEYLDGFSPSEHR